MPLQPGTTLGPYAVTALIGEGGMGQVYQATDTKLKRQVALKILPEAFSADPERLARFQREAEVLASLNHPGIAAIYGLEEADNTRALVLELVEGPTLADRIKRGPIPLDEALPIAKQIAEALEAAHEAGVIHRDLKPANIKVRDDGTVKVLDFGLAKALDPNPVGDPSQSPTLTAAATQMGVIMGTAAYMSPEQARGKPVDKRADIWAFGVVLYEMLTGQRAFIGDDVSLTLAKVLERDPSWESLPDSTPPSVRNVLQRCLDKDPRRRVQAAGDVRLALEGAFETTGSTASDLTAAPTLQLWQRPIPLAVTVLGLVVLTGLAVWSVMRPTDPVALSVRRFALDIGAATPIPIAGVHAMPAWSPDGTRLVYAANLSGTHQLYLRTFDELEARPIAGTEGAFEPFFSPDGDWVGFSDVVSEELKKVSVRGGAPLTLCDCAGIGGATWLPDGTIIVTDHLFGGSSSLFLVPEAGGTPEPLTTHDSESGEVSHLWPHALPGGTAVLFTMTRGPDANTSRVAVLSLDTGEQHIVVEGGFNARYVPTGHLVFGRQGALWGVPFDLDRLVTSGPEEVLLQGIEVNEYGSMALSVSGDGTLVYRPGDVGGLVQGGAPVWVDRTGQATPIGGDRRDVVHPRLSPDNARLAMTVVTAEGQDIWVDDLERGTSTRLTNDRTSHFPAWSLDGERVFFGSADPDSFGLYSRSADGSDERETVLTGEQMMIPFSWTPDGQALTFLEAGSSGLDIWTVSPEGDRSPYLVRPFIDGNHDLSPDGRWMAYISNESGDGEVYVQRYPELGEKVTISTGGGNEPLWSSDGRELFYRNLAGDRMMVVAVSTEPTLRVSRPEVLFEGRYRQGPGGSLNYDVSSDSQRFVMISEGQDGDPDAAPPNAMLILVQNWFEELTDRVPVD